VAELETLNLDAKLEIDSLKASPVVSDEVEFADFPIFLADLAFFQEKYASKCEELDVLRVEVAELKSRSALLGACTSCPVLHGKIDEMRAYTVSLEAKLKEPIPTSCSTCEMHALKNLELAHYVDRCQDENDKLSAFIQGELHWFRGSLHVCRGSSLWFFELLFGGLRSLLEHSFVSDVSSRCPCLRGPRLVFFK
jgi:hypothetical protein